MLSTITSTMEDLQLVDLYQRQRNAPWILCHTLLRQRVHLARARTSRNVENDTTSTIRRPASTGRAAWVSCPPKMIAVPAGGRMTSLAAPWPPCPLHPDAISISAKSPSTGPGADAVDEAAVASRLVRSWSTHAAAAQLWCRLQNAVPPPSKLSPESSPLAAASRAWESGTRMVSDCLSVCGSNVPPLVYTCAQESNQRASTSHKPDAGYTFVGDAARRSRSQPARLERRPNSYCARLNFRACRRHRRGAGTERACTPLLAPPHAAGTRRTCQAPRRPRQTSPSVARGDGRSSRPRFRKLGCACTFGWLRRQRTRTVWSTRAR